MMPANPAHGALVDAIGAVGAGEDRIVARDAERFAQSRQARADLAAQYFQDNAAEWNRVRALHLPELRYRDPHGRAGR